MSRHHNLQLRQQLLTRALMQMAEALHMLDDLGAPGDIGSQLDLAIARLGETLAIENPPPVSIEARVSRLAAGAGTIEAEDNEPGAD